MEFAAFPIGHTCTTLNKTLEPLTAAVSTVHHHVKQPRANMGSINPATDHNTKIHDFIIFKSTMQDSLTDLSQSRLIGII